MAVKGRQGRSGPLRDQIGTRKQSARVYLSEWEYDRLMEMCVNERSTMAELIRRKLFGDIREEDDYQPVKADSDKRVAKIAKKM